MSRTARDLTKPEASSAKKTHEDFVPGFRVLAYITVLWGPEGTA